MAALTSLTSESGLTRAAVQRPIRTIGSERARMRFDAVIFDYEGVLVEMDRDRAMATKCPASVPPSAERR